MQRNGEVEREEEEEEEGSAGSMIDVRVKKHVQRLTRLRTLGF